MSIRKRPSKKSASGYTYQIYFNYIDPYTKEKKSYSKSGFQSYEDALLYETKIKNELSFNNRYIKEYKVTFNDVFDEWLEIEAKYKYQDNTIIDYTNRYNKHIRESLGHTLVYEADYKLLQRYFNSLIHLGITTNYKLKEIINVLINFSIKCGYMHDNPLKYIHIVGKDNKRYKDKQVITDQEFDLVIKEILDVRTYIHYGFVIALYIGRYTGLRISETFALERDDFDFDNHLLYVNKKMVYANKKNHELYVTHTMKTEVSRSVLPLHDDLEIIMKKWFAYHKHKYVITNNKGAFINPKQLEYCLWTISKKYNISFHYHMLRHTLASNLIINGANVKATQEILRHSNIKTTMNIYTHSNIELNARELNLAFIKVK